MLSDKQREQVANLILNYMGMPPSPVTIQALMGLKPVRTAPPTTNAYRLALWLLDYTLSAPHPDLFIRVIAAVDAQQELVEVHELVERLRQDASLWRTHVLDELWVPPRWPFTDRQELRQVLLTMADGDGPPAITIEAPQGYGKRTMCAYIERLAGRHEGFRPVVTHLRQEPNPGVLDALVADLRIGLGLNFNDDTTHIEPERRAVVSARSLVLEATRAPSAAWLVANVIDAIGLEEGVLRFIDELLDQIQETPAELRRLRVVLLSDQVTGLGLEHLPDPAARYVLPEVDEAAITQWLMDAVPGKRAQLYSYATSIVLGRIEERRPLPAERLGWLARHCIAAHQLLVGTS